MKKIILAFTTVLLLAAACTEQPAVTQQNQTTTQTTQAQPAKNQTQPENNTTNNLKTYTNSQYGFEFQYPYKNLSAAEGYVSSIDPKGLAYIVNLFTIPHGQDRDGMVGVFNLPLNQAKESLGFAGQTLPTVKYNGISWTKLPRQDTPSDYLVEKNGQTFLLGYSANIKQADFESIINSFKFTTPTSQNTNLKTYTNSQYGFEFSYPSTYSVKIHEKSTVRGALFGVGLDSIAMGNVEGGYGPLAQIGIGVWDNSSQLSLVGWASDEYNKSFSNYGGDGFTDFKNQTLAGHKAISYSWAGLNGGGKTVVIENGKTIIMVTSANTETDKVWQDFETILSTFKFSK